MKLKKGISLSLAIFLSANAMSLTASSAMASDKSTSCAISMELSMEENDAIHMFHAQLSHLLYFYGKSNFESKLQEIISQAWPKTRLIQVSPFFFEQAQNMVDQERLKDSVARTIGLESEAWNRFDTHMRNITLLGSISADLMSPFEKAAKDLLLALNNSNDVKSEKMPQAFEEKKAEAILRATDMYLYLIRKKSINAALGDERAAVASKTMAVLAVGLVGASVLGSTLVISAPIVTGAGAIAGGLSTNPVVAALLVKVAEVAAGSAIGFVGAPAAVLVDDSFKTISEANKQSANKQTSYACELEKQVSHWQAEAGGKLLSAALLGATMGAAGGAATVTSLSAKLVLYGTGLGVGVAQLYALGKMSETAIKSVGYYRMAEEAEASGDHEQALEYLYKSRDLAQESQEQLLQSIIIGALSYHVSAHFHEALKHGESAIRQLYAASADTIPTAAQSVGNLIEATGVLNSGK